MTPENMSSRFCMYKLVAWMKTFMSEEHRKDGKGFYLSVERFHMFLWKAVSFCLDKPECL